MKRSLVTAVVSALVIGCIPSLNPIYREKDIVFRPELLGTWAEGPDEDETWVFERGEDKSYKLTYTDENGREGEFVVHLADIKGHLFLDFFWGDLDDLEINVLYLMTAIPGHAFAYVKRIEPELQLAFVDADWLGDYLEEHPRSLEHRIGDDYFFLTASTPRLQRFFAKHVETKDAFDDFSDLKRIPPDKRGE